MWWRNEDPTQAKANANFAALEHPVASAHTLLWCQDTSRLLKPVATWSGKICFDCGKGSVQEITKPRETRADCHCRKALPSGKNRTKRRGWWICKEVASTCGSKCILLRLRCQRLVTLLSVAAKGCISCCEQSSELRVRTGKGECGLWQV